MTVTATPAVRFRVPLAGHAKPSVFRTNPPWYYVPIERTSDERNQPLEPCRIKPRGDLEALQQAWAVILWNDGGLVVMRFCNRAAWHASPAVSARTSRARTWPRPGNRLVRPRCREASLPGSRSFRGSQRDQNLGEAAGVVPDRGSSTAWSGSIATTRGA